MTKLKWNKGRFGFWFHTKAGMRQRDAVMARIMETQGGRKERERVIKALEEMRDTCFASGTPLGDHNGWTLENAISLVKREDK